MMMKTTNFLMLGLVLMTAAGDVNGQALYESPRTLIVPQGLDVSQTKDKAKEALAELMGRFVTRHAGSPVEKYAIMPLLRDLDKGYLTLQFENAFVQAGGLNGFELLTREDAVMNEILKEVELQEIQAAAFSEEARTRLSLEGAGAIILPRVDIDANQDGSHTLRVNISVHEVATMRKLWGDEAVALVVKQKTPEEWVTVVGIGLAGFAVLVILVWFFRVLKMAGRARA
jgi:hypothetical protein